jgi:4'-phosphopantetheinyl transferase
MAYALGENEVHIWYSHCDDPDVIAREAEHLDLLSNDEIARFERFKFEKDRRLFLTARALLRISLSRYADIKPSEWKFQQTVKGKPYLNDSTEIPAFSFNVSHSGHLAVCAITLRHQIGVDIESTTRQADPRVTKYFMSPLEMSQYEKARPDKKQELFYRYWTLKEAYAKALGMGLSLQFTDFRFVWDHEVPRAALAPEIEPTPPSDEEPRWWYFHQSELASHYILSVAVKTHFPTRPRFVTYTNRGTIAD